MDPLDIIGPIDGDGCSGVEVCFQQAPKPKDKAKAKAAAEPITYFLDDMLQTPLPKPAPQREGCGFSLEAELAQLIEAEAAEISEMAALLRAAQDPEWQQEELETEHRA